jgi:putative transposase
VTNKSPPLWDRQSGVSNLIPAVSGDKNPSPGGVPAEAVVGVDVGLTHIAIESTGRRTDNPRYVTRAQRNLQRKQKSLSRKQKGSNRLRPDALSPRRMNALPNCRGDSRHTLPRRLVDENQAIVIETLKIKTMQKNRCLAKAIGCRAP